MGKAQRMVITTDYNGTPYYLKGVDFRHGQRTVIWTTDKTAARIFTKLEAADFMEKENLFRKTEIVKAE